MNLARTALPPSRAMRLWKSPVISVFQRSFSDRVFSLHMLLQRFDGLIIQPVDEIGNRCTLKDTTSCKNLPCFLYGGLSHIRAAVGIEADDVSRSEMLENLADMNTVAPERFDELIGDQVRPRTNTFEAHRPGSPFTTGSSSIVGRDGCAAGLFFRAIDFLFLASGCEICWRCSLI